MLACARLGAPHTVVFGGFSADALVGPPERHGLRGADHPGRGPAQRQQGAAEGERRRGALDAPGRQARSSSCGAPAATSTGTRGATSGGTSSSRTRPADPESCPCEPMDSEDLLYLLYTSGTTAKPKGIAHTTAGYLVGTATTHYYIFDVKPDSVYWCAADIGWVTGHSYIVYGPLCNGTTGVHLRGRAQLPGQGPLVGDRRALQGGHPLHGADGDPDAHEVGPRAREPSTTSPRCACSARSASRSTPRPGSGTASTSAATARRSSTRGGRPRPG